jgi:hypothetical protein
VQRWLYEDGGKLVKLTEAQVRMMCMAVDLRHAQQELKDERHARRKTA